MFSNLIIAFIIRNTLIFFYDCIEYHIWFISTNIIIIIIKNESTVQGWERVRILINPKTPTTCNKPMELRKLEKKIGGKVIYFNFEKNNHIILIINMYYIPLLINNIYYQKIYKYFYFKIIFKLNRSIENIEIIFSARRRESCLLGFLSNSLVLWTILRNSSNSWSCNQQQDSCYLELQPYICRYKWRFATRGLLWWSLARTSRRVVFCDEVSREHRDEWPFVMKSRENIATCGLLWWSLARTSRRVAYCDEVSREHRDAWPFVMKSRENIEIIASFSIQINCEILLFEIIE